LAPEPAPLAPEPAPLAHEPAPLAPEPAPLAHEPAPSAPETETETAGTPTSAGDGSSQVDKFNKKYGGNRSVGQKGGGGGQGQPLKRRADAPKSVNSLADLGKVFARSDEGDPSDHGKGDRASRREEGRDRDARRRENRDRRDGDDED
jgi:hypothetical protein